MDSPKNAATTASIAVKLASLAAAALLLYLAFSYSQDDHPMQTVVATTVANVPLAAAWEKLSDLSVAHNYVPGIHDTKITTEQTHGVGASRKVYSDKQPPLDETVVEWEPKARVKLRLHRGEAPAFGPFKQAFFYYEMAAEGENTRLTNTLEFEIKWGPLGKLLGWLMQKGASGMQNDTVIAQRLYYETGARVDGQALKTFKESQ